MSVHRGDFDTRMTVQERFNRHLELCAKGNEEQDTGIRAALQNEYLTRMRMERFVASRFMERVKWLLFGTSPLPKQPEAKVIDQTPQEAPKMEVINGDDLGVKEVS